MVQHDGLLVRGLTIRYAAHTAVSDVDIHAPRGRITGLIGPNGAGKTSTFNACSGLLAPASGAVFLNGRDVTGMPAHRRSQLGLGRTYQRMELFDSLTVRENVELGREAALAASNPLAHLRASRAERADIRERARRSMHLCGIDHLKDEPVLSLSTGQRRLVELARAVAGGKDLLLLDEPSSGLDHTETTSFGDILVHLVEEEGVGILLVEHDMALVMRVCDHIYVLDFGRPLFDGTPEQVQESGVVRAAYLGEAA